VGAIDQAVAQAALAPQPPLDTLHLTVVALMIVPEKVQQPV
jgi:hypothetical protein